MSFVLDSSTTPAWCFPDETTALALTTLERVRFDGAVVPTIWPLEIANGVLMGQRRRRITASQGREFASTLLVLPITVAGDSWLPRLLRLVAFAEAQELSAYDASYLDLALRFGLPLATLDSRLRDAATRVGVPLPH